MLKEHRLNQSFDIVVLHAQINVLLLLAVYEAASLQLAISRVRPVFINHIHYRA